MKQKIFILSGPSGAGEDSIISGLDKEFSIERVVNTTTRKKRNGEKEGEDYYFISNKDFEYRISSDSFIEYAQHYNGNYYGVSKDELERIEKSGKIGIWKMDYKGVISIKKIFPEILAILIMAESLKTLEERIRSRDGSSEEYIKERMNYTKEWLKHEDIYDFKVINKQGELAVAIKEVVDIIKKYI
jgi:guanylate kinase